MGRKDLLHMILNYFITHILFLNLFVLKAEVLSDFYCLRRTRYFNSTNENIEVPKEYRYLVILLYSESEKDRLEAIKQIEFTIMEKEKNENKRKALTLELVKKFSDRQEIVRESSARALKKYCLHLMMNFK